MSLAFNIPLVGQWAVDRNLIEGSTPKAQFLKHVEEGGEVFEGILKKDKDLVADAIGDTCVVITIILMQLNRKPAYYITDSMTGVLAARHGTFASAVGSLDVARVAMLFGQYQGELSRALAKGLDPLDHINKIISTLKSLANMMRLDFTECYRLAYKEIEHRKGMMVDGVFVKEEA